MKPKISIIIPIYNAEKYLKKCLDSIINQSYQNIEILCINDGSIDNSLSILKEYQKKDRRIILEDIPNGGVSKARNIAIKKATGNYIMFIDSDDYIEPNMVEKMLQITQKNKVDVVRCTNFLEDEKGKIHKIEDYLIKNESLTSMQITEQIISELINGTLLTYSCVLLIKKETLLKTELFNEKLKIFEDRVFYLNLFFELNKIYFLNEPLYHYVIHKNSCVNSKKLASRHLYNTIDGWIAIRRILQKYNQETKYVLRELNTNYLGMIMGYLYGAYKNEPHKFKETYQDMLKNPNIKEMIKNYNESNYKFFIKISIDLFKKDNYYLLRFLYFIRKIVSLPKNILQR